jgi:hypothetical protein
MSMTYVFSAPLSFDTIVIVFPVITHVDPLPAPQSSSPVRVKLAAVWPAVAP